MQPTEFIERGERIAVGLTVSNPAWHGAAAPHVFKVFGFDGDDAVLLQDCKSRKDAMAYLAAT